MLPYVRQVRHQQLFLAGACARDDLHSKPRTPLRGVGQGRKGIARKSPPPTARRPFSSWLQPPLFDAPPRTYRYGRRDLRTGPPPDNPWLAWALHLAHALAEARGFDSVVFGALNRVLVMLLAEHIDGDQIRFSDIHPVLRKHGNACEHTAHVLATMGILIDDRRPTFDVWLDVKLAGLPPAIADLTRQWAHTLHDGSPRSRPRFPSTVRNYVTAALPALHDWSSRYDHLREVTRDDVLERVRMLRGEPRVRTAIALRSLFAWAKRNAAVFRDPTRGISVGRPERSIPQPLTTGQINPTLTAASSCHSRLAIALAAIHAARHIDIRYLKLHDIDLGNRRLSVAGRDRPLDDLTLQVMLEWLDYRRLRWPNTANPHLLLSRESALRTGPVSTPWISRVFRGLPATLERLRIDRLLDEAIASGGDPLQVAAVFGCAEATAIHYARAARELLESAAELTTPEVHAKPPGTPPLDASGSPAGSS